MKVSMVIQGAAVPFKTTHANSSPSVTHIKHKDVSAIHQLLDNHFKVKNNVNDLSGNKTLKQTPTHNVLTSSGSDTPLELISKALSNYIKEKQRRIEVLAEEIKKKKKTRAVSMIQSLWAKAYQWGIEQTIMDKKFNAFECYYYMTNPISQYTKTFNDNWRDVVDITFHTDSERCWASGKNKNGPDRTQLNYIDAILLAYCDGKMAAIRKLEQQMKNQLTILSSARRELIDLRQRVIAYSDV